MKSLKTTIPEHWDFVLKVLFFFFAHVISFLSPLRACVTSFDSNRKTTCLLLADLFILCSYIFTLLSFLLGTQGVHSQGITNPRIKQTEICLESTRCLHHELTNPGGCFPPFWICIRSYICCLQSSSYSQLSTIWYHMISIQVYAHYQIDTFWWNKAELTNCKGNV